MGLRDLEPRAQLGAIATGMNGKRLTYTAHVADNARSSGARPTKSRTPLTLRAIGYRGGEKPFEL